MDKLSMIVHLLGIASVASPVVLLGVLGITGLVGIRLPEQVTSRLTRAAVVIGLLPTVLILLLMLVYNIRYLPIEFGNWVEIEHEHFHFKLKIVFDRLSIPFALLSFVLCGIVGEFTRRYLHREEGYHRFFLYYSLFFSGMVISSLAGTIETLFLGWELVGLSSALLVAYFHEHRNPVRNGLRVWSVYRIADASFLLAALAMHHLTGQGDFGVLMGQGPWPEGQAAISPLSATMVGSLLLIAAAGKSALIPFSGWLPRAMEGPTPSSAVFYGSLSVHLGVYLLLRVSPILDSSLSLRLMVLGVGALTAISASIMSRVQSDVKGSLAYASLTQVGIIVVEIGFGLRYLALIHIIGHACLRTLQLLRAPSLISDYYEMENAIGRRLSLRERFWSRVLPDWLQLWGYRFGFDRGFMDILLEEWIVRPFMHIFHVADKLERCWTDWLSHEPSRESDQAEPHPESTGPHSRATESEGRAA